MPKPQTKDEVHQAITKQWGEFTNMIREQTTFVLSKDSSRPSQPIVILCIVVVLIGGIYLSSQLLSYEDVFGTLFLGLLVLSIPFAYYKIVQEQKNLGVKLPDADTHLVHHQTSKLLSNILDIPIQYLSDHAKVREYEQLLTSALRQSQLVNHTTLNAHLVYIDQIYQLTLDEHLAYVCKLDVTYSVTGAHSNKANNLNNRKAFNGYIVFFDHTLNLQHRTFISTTTRGFGKTPPEYTNPDTLQTTQLEWSEFHDLLNITTTNETEARYILTPDMMADIYDWWNTQHRSIRMSFIGKHMYILYDSHTSRNGRIPENMTDQKLFQEVYETATILLKSIRLARDLPYTHRPRKQNLVK